MKTASNQLVSLKQIANVFVALGITFGVAACASSDNGGPSDGDGTNGANRGPIGKADALSGSCFLGSGSGCGAQSAGGCWCDDQCQSFGDCCVDYKAACTSPSCPDPIDPSVHYVNDSYKNPLACTNIYFSCQPGQTPFSDECGCGCIDDAQASCPDPTDPGVHYVNDSAGDPMKCATILFACEPGQTPFSNQCGCGCIDGSAPSCPDPNDPTVHYANDSAGNPAQCLAVLIACEPDQKFFSDACGCGCIDGPPASCPDPNDAKVHYVNGSAGNPAACLNILFGCDTDQSLFSNDCGCGCIDAFQP
jgi:hypothetical protein